MAAQSVAPILREGEASFNMKKKHSFEDEQPGLEAALVVTEK